MVNDRFIYLPSVRRQRVCLPECLIEEKNGHDLLKVK